MYAYLKDKRRENLLNDITFGRFNEVLGKACEEARAAGTFEPEGSVTVTVDDVTVRVRVADIAFADDRFKSGWNRFPQVTPPAHVPMRVEYLWGRGDDPSAVHRGCWEWSGSFWLRRGSPGVISVVEDGDFRDLRFRPWDD